MSHDKSFEPDSKKVLDILQKLPVEWPQNQETVQLHIIASKKDAGWISSRILDYVSDDFITAKIKADHSEYSVEMVVDLSINVDVDISHVIVVLTPFLLAIKSRAISGWLKHRNLLPKKRRKDNNNGDLPSGYGDPIF